MAQAARPAGAGECGTKHWARSGSGFPDDLSVEQAHVLDAFKASHEELLLAAKGLHEDMDSIACRYLRARQFDPAAAAKMLTEAIEWRRTFGGKGGVRELGLAPHIDVLGGVSADELRCFYQHRYIGTYDREGRPLYIERTGLIDSESLALSVGMERLLNYHVCELEGEQQVHMLRASQRAGRPVVNMCTILDMEGLSSSIVNSHSKAYFKGMSAVDANYYPEMMGKLFIVNAPTVFSAVWAVAKKFLDKRTVGKISIISRKANMATELLKHIPAESLPKEYGGTLDLGPTGAFEPSSTSVVRFSSKVKKHHESRAASAGERLRFRFHSKGGGMTFIVTFQPQSGGAAITLHGPEKVEKLTASETWVQVPSDGVVVGEWVPSRASGRTLFVRVEPEADVQAALQQENAEAEARRVLLAPAAKAGTSTASDSSTAKVGAAGTGSAASADAGVGAGAGAGAGAGSRASASPDTASSEDVAPATVPAQ